MLFSVNLEHQEQLRKIEESARRKEQAMRHDIEAYSAATVDQWEHRVSVLQGCVNERDDAIIQLQQDMTVLQECVDERDSALATTKHEADTVIAQLKHDMSVLQGRVSERDGAIIQLNRDMTVLQGRVDERDSALLIARQEVDGVIAELKHDMSVLQKCVDERDDALIQLHHDMTVLQGCVDERDIQINEARISAAEEQQARLGKESCPMPCFPLACCPLQIGHLLMYYVPQCLHLIVLTVWTICPPLPSLFPLSA